MLISVVSICGLTLSKYLSFTSFYNAEWLNIVDVVVASPIIPLLGFFVVYFLIAMEMYSISVTKVFGILIDGGCVSGPVPGLLFPDPEVCPDVGNRSSEMFSNISGLNEIMKCRLLMLR